MVGKTAICSLNTSSVWTDLEFGNSIRSGVTPEKERHRMKAEIRHVSGAYEKGSNIVVDVFVKDISTPVYMVRIELKTSCNGRNRVTGIARTQSSRFFHTTNRNGYIYLENQNKDAVILPELSVQIELISGRSIFSDRLLIELKEIVLEGPEGHPTILLSPNMALSYPSPSSPSLKDHDLPP